MDNRYFVCTLVGIYECNSFDAADALTDLLGATTEDIVFFIVLEDGEFHIESCYV